MIDVYETVARLQGEREGKGVSPRHVTYEKILSDINAQVKDELRNLCRQKKAKFSKTLNSVAFEVIN